ncbi:cell wall metabolism sensor histidine kinase WalK [Nocardioides sp.]|uniref:sensor histidine kinase n=1 Tax=Nocardioides sp. TaxID=35761 RepID=UPI00272471CF|nr:HAMP domain-containing sensor histidine kinase [Nocardioides sp.]MDO9457422.1 HAMP domain-containing sensor histidine kinase [Nocardioides sp.]
MRVRITATVALLTAVGLALAGTSVFLIEERRLDDRSIEGSQQELDEFAKQLDPLTGDVRPTLYDTLFAFLERNVPDADEALVGFVGDEPVVGNGNDAQVLQEDPEFRTAAIPLVDSGGTARIDDPDRGPLLLSSQPATIGDEHGAMVVVTYLDVERADLRDTMRTYLVVATLALLLITGVAFSQAGRLLRPLRTLRETADDITETDLSRRLPVAGNDDITALTRTINGMLGRLETAFVGQRQLLDDAGHELRTPLTILQGHLELLDADDPAEVAETRELLLDEVDRMARLVDDLILLAKTERPGFLTLAPVDAAALTEAVAAKAAGLGERDWRVDGVADVTVPVDQQRITQALLQLAHNAAKHTRPGDVVAVGSVREGDAVLWWVRDTGPGVAAVDRERIFERFGRGTSAETRDTEGFGLGLAIVTAIARAHGGDAWLDDDYRDGARFVVSVPLPPTYLQPPHDDSEETRPIVVQQPVRTGA